MPYYRKKRTWKRKRYAKRSTKYARPKRVYKRRKKTAAIRKYPGTAKQRSYAIPRLQLATTRQKSRFLKFRGDFEWTIAPEWTGQPAECLYLRIRANSIQDILAIKGDDQSGLPNKVWQANDPSYIPMNTDQQFPEGVAIWQGQYYHYTVIASKVTVIFNSTDGTELHDPSNTAPRLYQPAIAFVNKMGTEANIPINRSVTKEQLATMPYTVMGQLAGSTTHSGTKLSMGYSAKRFESVPSPLSSPNLRGTLAPSGSTITGNMHPNEQTFFHIGVLPARGYAASTTDYMQPMQCQLKVEYAVVLTEPTPAQLAGIPPGPNMDTGGGAAAPR